MPPKTNISRRQFLKSSALGSSALLGSSVMPALLHQNEADNVCLQKRSINRSFLNLSEGEIAGLLFSQIGYEQDRPVRVVIRLPRRNTLPGNAACRISYLAANTEYSAECRYWGAIWGSHWWVAEFDPPQKSGFWKVAVEAGNTTVMESHGLQTGEEILWNESAELASVDILERRKHFTNLNAGWQDAGTLWVESPAQSAMVIGLTELLLEAPQKLDENFKKRIYEQLVIGCDYLVMTQQKAEELSYKRGAMSHDLFGHEHDILPGDVSKAVVALLRTARLLPDSYRKKSKTYRDAADLSLHWLLNEAKPLGNYGFSYAQRGLPKSTAIPANQFQTRHLVTQCWAALESWKTGNKNARKHAARLADEIIERQIPESSAEHGFYGHFYEYRSLPHSQKSWSHGIVNNQFGADLGGIYPNYLMPLVEMVRLWPGDPNASTWKGALRNFTYGYLKPACAKSPFQIIPVGIFGDEGPIWFAGPFHGTNTIYSYTAALCFELAKLFDDEELNEIGYANLQWIAGLNSGLTKSSLKASVVYSRRMESGEAVPVSMMCQVGRDWAGSWFATRGVVCNGFSTGAQFHMDVPPVAKNDRPESFTDEDWIPHSAAWITGLVRL